MIFSSLNMANHRSRDRNCRLSRSTRPVVLITASLEAMSQKSYAELSDQPSLEVWILFWSRPTPQSSLSDLAGDKLPRCDTLYLSQNLFAAIEAQFAAISSDRLCTYCVT